MDNASDRIARMVTLDAYQASRSHIFPSTSSVRWQARSLRAELVEAGAIAEIAGRTLVDPEIFDAVVLKVGAGRAAA